MTTLTTLLKQYREGKRDMPTYAELVVYATEMDVMETQLKNTQELIIGGAKRNGKTAYPSIYGNTYPSIYN